MKTTPAPQKNSIVLMLVTVLFSSFVNAQTVYETRQAGNWMSASTWKDNLIPPSNISAGQKVIIRHWTLNNNPSQLYVYGTLEINGDTLRWQIGSGGTNVNVHPGGLVDIKNGGLIMP